MALSIELNPNYAQAYARLAWAYLYDYQNGWSDDDVDSLAFAEQNVGHAIQCDPDEPIAQVVASILATYRRDPERAKAEAELALALNPTCTEAYAGLGNLSTFSGKPLDGIPTLEASKHVSARLIAYPVLALVQSLPPEHPEEPLACRVVGAMADVTHA